MVFLIPDWRPRRSALFMPASNARALHKARTLPADTLIFDLEDSLGPGERETAYANLRELVKGVDFGRRERVIRTSAVETEGFSADFEMALECSPDAVLLPKVEHADTLVLATDRLDRAGSSAKLWAMIESPKALVAIADIASASSRLQCLVVGPNDLAKTTGVAMRPGRMAMIPWFMTIIAAARANDLCVLDGVYNNFRDTEGFAAECAQAAELGFDGKTLIHPSQIDAANTAFTPLEEEFERARRIVEAFADPTNKGRGAIALDGEMVERLHLDSAMRLLEAHKVLDP
ncbi:MAG: CoA ester lyase [Salaquimonas sp.]|nr:CoA ester lyase [Salaquimonas sp.]